MPRVASAAAAHVGAQIAHFRTWQGMTQDHLRIASDIDSSNIRSYESGRAMMNVRSLVRIADALGVLPGDLIDGVSPGLFDAQSAVRSVR
ncbi:MAG: helix-turn-helix domain-containing protein [Microbacterium gubbeenense]